MIQLQNITFSYPGQTIFENITWQIAPKEHYGLVGPNGEGKTTLLYLIAGKIVPDTGIVVRPRGTRIGYLSQAPQLPSSDTTVRQILMRPLSSIKKIETRMISIQNQLNQKDTLSQEKASLLAEELGELQEDFQRGGGYSIEAKLQELIDAFGFSTAILDQPVAPLSGGEKSRVMLAEVLLGQPDVLLLDEPTNHLDISGVEKLEELLEKFSGAVLVVSHDRYLLDRVVGQIVEVAAGKLHFYPGGYSSFTKAREKRLASEQKIFEQQQEEIARQEEFIRKNLAGQKTNQAKSRRKALEKMERVMRPEDVWAQANRLGLHFESGSRAPKVIATAKNLSKSYEDTPILSEIELIVTRGEKIGIIGPNGSGKSTLLKCLIGKLMPEKGEAQLGMGVSLGYLDQEVADRVSDKNAVEELMSFGSSSGLVSSIDATRQYLSRFRFFGEDVFRATKSFSGGERTRLALAKILLNPKNVLALDEPTNHLDIPTREILEKTLQNYDGTLLVVSHDRYFLDQVAQKILRVDQKTCETFLGNYSEFRQKNSFLSSLASKVPNPERTEKQSKNPARESKEEREKRHAREKERKKLEKQILTLEQEISLLEIDHQALEEKMAKHAQDDWNQLAKVTENAQKTKKVLESKMQHWEDLNAQLEKTRKT